MNVESKQIEITANDLRGLFEDQKCCCALTGKLIEDPSDMSLDHINPRKLGGEDDITNLQWVVNEVNRMKGTLSNQELFDLCQEILTFNGYTVEAPSE